MIVYLAQFGCDGVDERLWQSLDTVSVFRLEALDVSIAYLIVYLVIWHEILHRGIDLCLIDYGVLWHVKVYSGSDWFLQPY